MTTVFVEQPLASQAARRSFPMQFHCMFACWWLIALMSADIQTDKKTYRLTDTQTGRETYRQTDRQTE